MLKRNIIANFMGSGWSALMGLAFIPLYIKYLGMEAYGLVGLYSVLQAWLGLFDAGMTPTLNREMARYKAGAIGDQQIRDVLRTVEVLYSMIAILIAGLVWVASPILANSWLKLEHLSAETATRAIILMGFVVATRLWEEVYRGALQGMQKQVWLNAAQATLATLRWGGAFVALLLVSPTIEVFFAWQGAVSLLSVLVYSRQAYRWLPETDRAGRFRLEVIKEVGNFAGGTALITFLALLLTQIDKILLSGMLTLDQFGYYTLASLMSGYLAQLVLPINGAVYPRFTELITGKDEQGLIRTYHDACQLMAVVLMPPALILSAFAMPVLKIWTGNHDVALSVAPLLAVMVLGVLFNGLVNVPYMLQLAYGWTKLAIRMNVVAVFIVVPAILLVVPRYGAMGAAWISVLLNTGYILMGVQFMYRKLLPEEKWKWYLNDIARPLGMAMVVAYGLARVLPGFHNRLGMAMVVVFAGICTFLAVLSALPGLRHRLLNALSYSQ